MTSYTFTNPTRGDCDNGNFQDCSNVCDLVNVCVTIQRGGCDYANDLFHAGSPSELVAIHRDVILFKIRFQNCSGSPLRISLATLDFTNKFLIVNPSDGQESVVQYVIVQKDSTQALDVPSLRILQFTTDKSCGTINPKFGAGLLVFNDSPSAIEHSTETAIFTGTFTVLPGECCLDLIVGIDQINDAMNVPGELVLERACLTFKGFLMKGSSCCQIQQSVILPGDCALRMDRATKPPL